MVPQKADEKGLIVIIEEANKSKLQDCEPGRSGEVFENDPTGNIIDFESARKALEKNGVRQFSPRGEKFDPNVHQAMFEVPNPSVPAGSVVEVAAPGYMIGERVLRPAMVGVSKGGPKTAPASRAVNDNATADAGKDS